MSDEFYIPRRPSFHPLALSVMISSWMGVMLTFLQFNNLNVLNKYVVNTQQILWLLSSCILFIFSILWTMLVSPYCGGGSVDKIRAYIYRCSREDKLICKALNDILPHN